MSVFQHSKRLVAGVVACTVVLGALCRCMATRGELWLDEAWSVVQVSSISSPVQIMTTLLHDNNHPLNSLWIYLCGVDAPEWLLRAPAVLFGIATLLVIARYAPALFGNAVARVWLVLCAVSYPLTLYSSEARGYSLTILCAISAFLILASRGTPGTTSFTGTGSAKAFAVIASIGCLAHGTFALFVAAALVWLGYLHVKRPSGTSSQITWGWLRVACGPVLLVGALLTLVFYGRLEIGGGPVLPYIQVFFSTVAASFGGDEISAATPEFSAALFFAAVCILVALLTELALWMRRGDPVALLAALILAAPLVAVVALQPHFILARYFLFQVVILYLLTARFLVRLWSQNSIGKLLAVTCIAAFTLGNLRHTRELLTEGRSHFQDVLRLLAQCTGGTPTTLGADQAFQVNVRVSYARLKKVPAADLPIAIDSNYHAASSSAEYVVREAFEHLETLPPEFTAENGRHYRATCDSIDLPFFQSPLMSAASIRLYKAAELPNTNMLSK